MADEVALFDGRRNSELLRRQVHPVNLSKDGSRRVLSAAFTPRWKRDEADGRMSHLRGRVSGEDAWQRHTDLGLSSAGTWTASVGFARGLGMQCGDDSKLPGRPRQHCFVELRDESGWKHLARALARDATERGPLYTP